MTINPLAITAITATSSVGLGLDAHRRALHDSRTGLQFGRFETTHFDHWFGAVAGVEQVQLPERLADWQCRNNHLAWLGLQQDGFIDAVTTLRTRYGAERIGCFIGTSTAGIQQTELAFRAHAATGVLPEWFHYAQSQNCFSAADFVRHALQLDGVSSAISTACSSSAKVFASAARAIASGQCDAAVVGGVDSLCLTTVYGFHALQLISPDICRPADAARSGISLGEAAGFAILQRVGDAPDSCLRLLGTGESSDAYHMSSPDPEGRGARGAMQQALSRAGLNAVDIDYINLHGTATPANDIAEDRAVVALFGTDTPCSSTKGWTGHTLGAAGIVEAALCSLALSDGLLPYSLNTQTLDPEIRGAVLRQSVRKDVRHVLSNSFGFGGSNCSLLLGRA